MSGIGMETMKKVAKTARINLTDKEAEKFSKDLESILDAFRKLDKANTSKVKPSFQPLEIKNVFREDSPKNGLSQKQALENAKHKENGYFKGPSAV